MPIEHEAKVLDIDPAATQQLILDKGGKLLGEKLMRRYVYDITPGDQSKWLRLRDTGSEVTLTVKEITSDAIDGTHETEVVVSDFIATNQLLAALGFFIAAMAATASLEGSPIGILSLVSFLTWLVWLALISLRLLRSDEAAA